MNCLFCSYYDICLDDKVLVQWGTHKNTDCYEFVDDEFNLYEKGFEVMVSEWELVQDQDWLDWLEIDASDNGTIKFY